GGQPLLASNFDEAGSVASAWLPLSGAWQAHDGIYSQSDNTGYDYISFLNLAPQTHYSFETKLRLGEGDMGGGFVYNVPGLDERAGAQIVDFDNKGGFLRWGRYDDTGAYTYEGGVKVDPPINDGQWHDLRLVTHAGTSVVSLDGRDVGTIANTRTSGYLGLLTSKTKVDFDNVNVTILAENGAPAAQPTAAPTQANFADDFADGDAKGWQVLSGTWQVIDNAYQQTNPSGSDLGSIAAFQSDSYSATVRLKRIDGDMGGGLYFNLAQRDKKSRSQMISYTQSGKALQWGHFDDGGNFVFEGSAPTPDGGDGEWHTLGVQVKDGKATFTLDGEQVAKDVALTYTSGYLGLLASNSKVAFDDIQFVRQ
ncbi:MAG TPA: family 16 glycoside hydrolase, partial [Roseiflexaceae bacterium]|nr:family 16 glycoside hydrolase [Roseiflexaceae bacterium]